MLRLSRSRYAGGMAILLHRTAENMAFGNEKLVRLVFRIQDIRKSDAISCAFTLFDFSIRHGAFKASLRTITTLLLA